METEPTRSYSVFADFARHLHTGTDLAEAVARGHEAHRGGGVQTVALFDDTTGDRTEIDPEGRCAWLDRERTQEADRRQGPGRPKLGVVSREISLLPRHWDWLASQPNGASAAIRRLVDEARAAHRLRDLARTSKDAAYRFMSVVGGDRPNFEEASRALYAGQSEQAIALVADWPRDIAAHLERLLRAAAEHDARARAEAAATERG
jgi:hypothetical protein